MKEINSNEFDNIIKSDKLVLIDFYATWCGPCKALMPNLEKLNVEFKEIYKIDVDKEEDLSDKYEVNIVPTLILFKNGQEISRTVGYKTIEELKNVIKEGEK